MNKKIKVLVVDDSALIRSLLSEIINRQSDMICVSTASNPKIAKDLILKHNPDVLTLDIEMPQMNGLEFLEQIMKFRPMPIIMISTLTEKGANSTLKALELGAFDFVTKPQIGILQGLNLLVDEITEKIRLSVKAKINRKKNINLNSNLNELINKNFQKKQNNLNSLKVQKTIIVIGASTGGPEAIREFLQVLPENMPTILITQHMPAGFTSSFAQRLNNLCQLNVKEAQNGEIILAGNVYIAPGGTQFSIIKNQNKYLAKVLSEAESINRHKPSVEVLFESVAKYVGKNAIGIMLTGMGNDGSKAMLKMKLAGSYNFAQDEESCVVFGMPKEAIKLGGVDEILPLSKLASSLLEKLK